MSSLLISFHFRLTSVLSAFVLAFRRRVSITLMWQTKFNTHIKQLAELEFCVT